MVNLLGDIWFADARRRSAARARLERACCGIRRRSCTSTARREPRRGRKMGHVTCLAATLEEALATARAIKRDLGIPEADLL